MLNYENLIFLFLILLIITALLYCLNLYPKKSNIYPKQSNIYKYFENFDSSNTYSNNLIKNSNFTNNEFLYNSKIIKGLVVMKQNIQNPGLSSKVIELSGKDTFESITTVYDIQDNVNYKFTFWYAIKNGTRINNQSIINIFKFHVDSKDMKNCSVNIDKISDNQMNKSTLNNLNWYRLTYSLKIPCTLNNNQLYITISSNSIQSDIKVYITDITLTRILEYSPDFNMTKHLKLLVDSNSFQTNTFILKDKSGEGNDLVTDDRSNINYKLNNGRFSLYNNDFKSSVASQIFGTSIDNITISMYINIQQPTLYNNLLVIPGNQLYALSISIDNRQNYGIIIVQLNNDERTTLSTYDTKLVLGNTLITITYSKKYKELAIFQENNKIAFFNVDIKLLPSSEESVQLNLKNNNNGHLSMFGLAIWSALINNTNDLTTISNYFQHQRVSDKTSITKHVFADPLDITNTDNEIVNDNNDDVKKNNNDSSFLFIDDNDQNKIDKDDYNNNYINSHNDFELKNQRIPHQLHNLKQRCKNAIKKECNDIDNDKQYDRCVRKVDINNDDCLNYCNITQNKNTNLCKVDDFQCPYVYIKNQSYYVNIPKNCKYYKYLNKDDIDYGKNRHKALKLYERNFPDCDIPDILKYPDGEHPSKNCPFKLHDNNPCNDKSCNDINWKYPIQEQPVCQECKYSIAHYCKKNAEIDDSCICWSEEFKDLGECKAFRKFYEDPNDYQCNIDKFKIEEHPDFNKYIKKSTIPCWNCNLETNDANYNKVGNRYNR